MLGESPQIVVNKRNMCSVNERLIREQIEMLTMHIQRGALDFPFIERHARFIADAARFESEEKVATVRKKRSPKVKRNETCKN